MAVLGGAHRCSVPPRSVCTLMRPPFPCLPPPFPSQAQLEDQVTLFVNMAGACERIYKTPIPSPYTRHTSRFLMIFLTASPILMWPAAQWATPFIMAFVAFL